MRTAVIVAAGLGSRLKGITNGRPKGFLTIGDKPIVEQSIIKLIEHGIDRILIGTGYRSEDYEQLMRKYPVVFCVKNSFYESTGSMRTLYNLREHLDEDFILLESDLIYDASGLRMLINDIHQDAILASGKTHSQDEVYIETDDESFLKNMSKDPKAVSSIDTELVGISKISRETFLRMCEYAERAFPDIPQLDYEYALVGVSRERQIYVKKITDFTWCEIDDENHLNRARQHVYPRIEEHEQLQAVRRNILLNPGPATTTQSVKMAQVVPDICPREHEFGELLGSLAQALTGLVADPYEYTAILFCGSGTAAVEAILSSVVDGNRERILIVNNGAYGERMCRIADVYGLDYVEFKGVPDQPLDLEKLKAVLAASSKPVSHLAIVHNETTTGLLNDIQAVGDLCAERGMTMIVDAMSSFAAVPIDMRTMHIGFLAASSNKNLQGMAGVGFVIAEKNALERTKTLAPRSFYLNLYAQYKALAESNQMRFTPPVQTLYALKQAVLETIVEGVAARYARYTRSWHILVDGLEGMGLRYLVPKEHHSKLITAICEPDHTGYDFTAMHDYLYARGFTIYPGKLGIRRTFRVANIGDISGDDMKDFLSVLRNYFKHIGYLP